MFVYDAEKLKVHGGILRVFVSLQRKKIGKKFKKIISKENDKTLINKIRKLNLFRTTFGNKVKKLSP